MGLRSKALGVILGAGAAGVTLALALGVGCGGRAVQGGTVKLSPVESQALRTPAAFSSMGDKKERSRALFVEASRVMLHPRCVNCHPAGDSPTQRDDFQVHDPPVTRGPADQGVPGLECTSCHQDRNVELARVPGAPKWHLAPKVMAWQGRTLRSLCEQLKDPARNGGKSLAEIVEHSAHDELVGWGWKPGSGRVPAPGTQAEFGALMAAWVSDGAECPREEGQP
ncbi:Isoquinoline 1-oxidoreductase subunit [Corallococcus llansteffanensis]|uniref:Isoquinoline 1-oxidoreductase subunit n=1 Tax=Corallococcus llansteffanensis TaxID=2316731 RepID=A0A3A8N695_9BACT|nr:Isoquinoline 1-oxidoreductase subunit [Corallococcus llansteffanensis]RKH39776.1 Isoquinoline 1-oxidoreductase subunit [Corallococcus llansteffanensis]